MWLIKTWFLDTQLEYEAELFQLLKMEVKPNPFIRENQLIFKLNWKEIKHFGIKKINLH